MKFLELFAGIGGFRLGLEKAGHKCVYTNEFEKQASSIYEYNFKEKPDQRDIRNVKSNELPKADLIVAGFPCATFSIAGRRTGFSQEDTRGTLFFEICRIAKERKIPYLFLENVKGLLNHDNGRTFGVILSTLWELGYDVQWECLNSKNFGVAQNRERVFIVANIRNKPRPKVFPIGECFAEDAGQINKTQKKGERISTNYLPTLDANYAKGGGTRAVIQQTGETADLVRSLQWRRNHFRQIKGHYSPTLTENMGTGGNNVPFVEVRPVLSRFITSPQAKRQNGRRIKNHNEPSFTVTAQDRHGVLIGDQLRKLTPLECERLQSLPDNWTKYYHDGSLVSDSKRYEKCGRSVTVNVIYEIAKRLFL